MKTDNQPPESEPAQQTLDGGGSAAPPCSPPFTPETDAKIIEHLNMPEIHDRWLARLNRMIEFARQMERSRDEWRAKYLQQNKDLGCELRDPNGTIWDHAKQVQADLDELRRRVAKRCREAVPTWAPELRELLPENASVEARQK